MSLLKSELRIRLREEIAALPDDYISVSNEGILVRVLAMREFKAARNIMAYHSVEKEPDTLELVDYALSMGKSVAFPFCYRGGVMEARAVNSLSELRPAMLGIPAPPDTAPIVAPEELDLVIVPALAYDRAGYRLGYGGGYYDRFLSGIPAFTVGLARERLIKDDLPAEAHDVAVSCVVTECRILH